MVATLSGASRLLSVRALPAVLGGARRGDARSALPALAAAGFAGPALDLAAGPAAMGAAGAGRGIGEAEAVIVPPRAPSASGLPKEGGSGSSVPWLARWWRPNRDSKTTCHKQALLWPNLGESTAVGAAMHVGVAKRARLVRGRTRSPVISGQSRGRVAWQ